MSCPPQAYTYLVWISHMLVYIFYLKFKYIWEFSIVSHKSFTNTINMNNICNILVLPISILFFHIHVYICIYNYFIFLYFFCIFLLCGFENNFDLWITMQGSLTFNESNKYAYTYYMSVYLIKFYFFLFYFSFCVIFSFFGIRFVARGASLVQVLFIFCIFR